MVQSLKARLYVQVLVDKTAERLNELHCTAHWKWKESKQQPSMLLGQAVPVLLICFPSPVDHPPVGGYSDSGRDGEVP